MPDDGQSTAPDDPYLRVLMGIAYQLSAIAHELQRANDAREHAVDGADIETFDCRCGETPQGEMAARRHSIDEHNAPPDHWREMYADQGD